ncbi:MAG: pyridoxamine 5'-phosphate oxidase family protein [Ruminococcus sp.]|nr:pyridoxamine 5'-phosphate oxidase family protein [Ruminococcus sp.]
MRRNDREITDRAQIESFIAEEKILRVGFCDGGEVYIVPVNYGYTVSDGKYTFYFHGAQAGRKYDLAAASPKVGFEIDGKYQLLESEAACGHSAKYQSVIGTGTLSLVEDIDEKKAALDRVMKQATGKSDWDYPENMLSKTAVFRLEADKLSCKAK